MYKDKEKQKEANRKASKKYRAKPVIGKVETESNPVLNIKPRQGMTQKKEGMTEGTYICVSTPDKEGGVYPDIVYKLTDPTWRKRLEKICLSVPKNYRRDIWVGVPEGMFVVGEPDYQACPLDVACDWLEVTG